MVVLVIEDNSELRNVLKEALTAEGYQVLPARDEADALAQLRSGPVDLLISDLTSPQEEDGLETVTKEFPTLPVVALQAAPAAHPPFFFGAWQGAGRYRTLPKPFRLRDLLAVSRDVLDAAS